MKSYPHMGVFFMVNSSVVTGTNPQVFPCIGNRTYNASQMSVLTSGCGGMNYGKEIQTAERQRTQEVNGVNVCLSLEKW